MYKIPLIKSSANIPIVEFQLQDGVMGYAILDTGSEITIFDGKFVNENKKNFNAFHNGNIITMVGLYAEHEDKDIHVSCELHIDKAKIKVNEAMIADLNFIGQIAFSDTKKLAGMAAIIGCDTMLDNKVKIDFKNDLMII